MYSFISRGWYYENVPKQSNNEYVPMYTNHVQNESEYEGFISYNTVEMMSVCQAVKF